MMKDFFFFFLLLKVVILIDIYGKLWKVKPGKLFYPEKSGKIYNIQDIRRISAGEWPVSRRKTR